MAASRKIKSLRRSALGLVDKDTVTTMSQLVAEEARAQAGREQEEEKDRELLRKLFGESCGQQK